MAVAVAAALLGVRGLGHLVLREWRAGLRWLLGSIVFLLFTVAWFYIAALSWGYLGSIRSSPFLAAMAVAYLLLSIAHVVYLVFPRLRSPPVWLNFLAPGSWRLGARFRFGVLPRIWLGAMAVAAWLDVVGPRGLRPPQAEGLEESGIVLWTIIYVLVASEPFLLRGWRRIEPFMNK